MLRTISKFDAQHRLLVGTAIAAVTFFVVRDRLSVPARIVATWDVYAVTTLAMAWISIVLADPQEIRKTTSLQDSGRTLILVLLLLAAVTSIFSVVMLLSPARNAADEAVSLRIALAFLAVVCSWMVVHTTFTLHYAHRFYDAPQPGSAADSAGGLLFPGTERPDYLDFAYFSFVVGMTSQVSDIQITSRPMRRLALLHGVIAFGFNTMVLALGINVLSGLL